MFRYFMLSILLRFNLVLSTNLEDYIFQMVEKTSEKFEVESFDECFFDTWPTVTVGVKAKGLIQLITTKTVYLLDLENNGTEKLKDIIFTPEKYGHALAKAFKFIVVIADTITLKNRLIKLKNSAFWYVFGYFLIINVNNCQMTYSHLKVIWEFNILNAVYYCQHPKNGLSPYIFNPFNEDSPKNWKKIASIYQQNKHPMTIFTRLTDKESQNVTNCEAYLFDKVKNLSGYPVKVAEINSFVNVPDIFGKVSEINSNSLGQKYMHEIWSYLGAMVEYVPKTEDEIGSVDSDGSSNGVVGQILEGIYECRSDVDFSRGFWLHELKTYVESRICFITRKESISFSEHFEQNFPVKLRIIYLIFFVIVTGIYVYLRKGDSVEVILDIFRAAMGQSMIFQPQNPISSMIFSALVFVFMIITMELQSLLSAFVSTSITVGKDVRFAEDIARYNLHAYGDPFYSEYYRGTALENKISPLTEFTECLEMLRKNSSIACINDCYITIYSAQKDDELHVSQDNMFSRHYTYLMRDDSPFMKKMQSYILSQLENGNIYHCIDMDKSQYKKVYESAFTKIRIDQLQSAFYVLFSLIILSFIILFAELVVHYIRRVKNKIKHNDIDQLH